jgi:hypothetical protein
MAGGPSSNCARRPLIMKTPGGSDSGIGMAGGKNTVATKIGKAKLGNNYEIK